MDVSLQDVLGMPFIQNSNFGHLKDASMLNSLNNKRKAITNANFVDLTSSDDHSEHSESSFIQDVSLPSQVAFKSGRKRRKIDSPHEGKLTVTAVNAERIREKKRIQHSVVNNELPFFSLDAGSSSYKHTQSFCNSDESYDCTHTCLQKEEPKSLSQSRSTPIFYGDESEGNSFAKSMEFHDTKQNEDQERSSTKTFYGNTTDNSRHSSSTAVFYGSYADEAHLSMAEDPLDLRRSLESNMNIHDHVCVCAKVPYDHDTVDEANSISAADSKIRDPAQCCHEFDDNSQCFCNIVQISSDHSQSVCRGCNSLMMDDKKLIITPTSSEGESHKETRVVVLNSSSCRKGQDGLECQSESQPMYKHAMSMKVHEEVQQKQNRKLNLMPSAKKRVWKNAGSVCSQARQTHCQNRASRLSIALGKERNLNDLFDAILRRVRELRHVRMVAPSGDQFASTEEILNQVPWDPIIFHSIPNVHRCGLKDPDPLTDIWRDMELAFHEVNGVAALAKKEGTLSEDKVLACDHNLVLSELEGHICAHCGLLVTSVENILAPVLQGENYKSRDSRIELVKGLSATCTNNDEHQKMPRAPFETDLEAAWQLIKELKPLLQKHQVDGFNFLWKNVGALSRQTNKEGGGCIIAHAPGTGKSLLIISFLKSFLHLHSWCRPLIVAPKNMLLSWKNEFEKWKAGVKVYLLQASSPLTYLSTISEWQKNTSVLIINYHLFSHLVDERRLCKTFNVQRIGSLLLHIPDILVLDEGHVPRNCSKLRESLLQIRTRFKILVSGTLFHNNVQELFNLLYLARPNFLSQLPMRHINTRFDGIDIDNYNNAKQWQTFEDFDKQRWAGASNDQVELKLRKVFMEEIGYRLAGKESGGDDTFRHAVEQLQGIMAPFTHLYSGDILNSLPGIREYIVVLQATSLQISLSAQIGQQTFLETALSIHPSLLLEWKGPKLPCFIDLNELQAIRGDPLQGPKVKFVLDLAECCHLLKEKLLIFSQFITTMELVRGMLQRKFQVALIKGKDKLEERQRTIEEFNEAKGNSVLLASLTACGEGINLTGASRVVFLDMHWNPARMKQAVARAFRIGQERIVHTYWLVASVEKEAEKFTRIHRKDWLSRTIFSSKAEFMSYNHSEIHANVEMEDCALSQLLRNNKDILKVLNYSASEREKSYAFFEQCGIPGR